MTRPNPTYRFRAMVVLAGSFCSAGLAGSAAAQDAAGSATAQAAAAAQAMSAMMISPLRVDLAAAETADTIRVVNSSGAPLAIQARLFSWAQQANEEAFAPSSDLLVTPSIVTIPAGQTQIVRVVRKGPSSQGEKRYKLIVDQLPDPNQAKAGVAMTRIRFALPVFIDSDKAQPARFDWQLSDGALQLRNLGGATARIVKVEVTGADGRAVPVDQNTLRYAFGANTITWPVTKGCSFGKVRVTAHIDGQTIDAEPTASCG